MADAQPDTTAKMKLLGQVNRRLIAAEKKAAKARARSAQADEELTDARRALKRALDSMQPELPAIGSADCSELPRELR